jgi:hypothetical protein
MLGSTFIRTYFTTENLLEEMAWTPPIRYVCCDGVRLRRPNAVNRKGPVAVVGASRYTASSAKVEFPSELH